MEFVTISFRIIKCLLISPGVLKEIFRQPIFRTLGRLTFGAYLIHPAIIRVSYGNLRQPIYGSDFKIVNFSFIQNHFTDD